VVLQRCTNITGFNGKKRENNHSNCPITLVTIIEAVVPEQPAASCLGDADAVSSSWLLTEMD
jgi:hypothetical protein